MHGDIEADPVVVYGIVDVSYEEILDTDWLYENFEDIRVFFCNVTDGGYGNPIYGCKLTLDETTGMLSEVTKEMKDDIDRLYRILLKYRQDLNSKNAELNKDNDLPTIGYYAAISDVNGDNEKKYIPELDNTSTPKEEDNDYSDDEHLNHYRHDEDLNHYRDDTHPILPVRKCYITQE